MSLSGLLASKSDCAISQLGITSKPRTLYHYTSPDTFVAIGDSAPGRGFACTNYRFLNDEAEFFNGGSVLRRWVERRAEIRDGSIWNAVRAKMVKNNLHEYAPWVLSFSTKEDDTVQWAVYTDRQKGGYALGVNLHSLKRQIEDAYGRELTVGEKFACKRSNCVTIGPCVYLADNKEEVVNNLLGFLDKLLIRGGVSLYDDEDACADWVLRFICHAAAFIKSGNFRFENEWRVVMMRPSMKWEHDIEFIGGKPRLFLRGVRAVDVLERVVVSHHGNADQLRTVADFLKRKHSGSFSIVNSKSTFRG